MSVPLAPVRGGERIGAIDAVRGFALLGILLVNIQSFGEVFGEFMIPKPAAGAAWSEVAAFYFVKVFCESKFYPLFSMLFGFGLMMQASRAAVHGRSYWGPGFRRYAFLILLGAAHALLLWFGDILFIYGVAGMILLLMHRAGNRALMVTGSVALLIGVLLMAGFSLLSTPPKGEAGVRGDAVAATAAAEPDSPEAAAEGAGERAEATVEAGQAAPEVESVIESTTPVLRLFRGMEAGKGRGGPSDPFWMEMEREAFAGGSARDRLLFNAFNWAMFLIVCLAGFGWHVLAMLCFGAVLFRKRLFDESRAVWHRRLVWIGLLVGLPVCVLGAVAGRFLPMGQAAAVFSVTSMVFGPLLSLGYLGAVTLLVRGGKMRWLTDSLACVGRLALSNYLLQTVAASAVFYEWGLGMYDETTRAQRIGIVVCIFAAQTVLSVLWLKAFRIGPVEWLWRTVTYLRFPAVLKG